MNQPTNDQRTFTYPDTWMVTCDDVTHDHELGEFGLAVRRQCTWDAENRYDKPIEELTAPVRYNKPIEDLTAPEWDVIGRALMYYQDELGASKEAKHRIGTLVNKVIHNERVQRENDAI